MSKERESVPVWDVPVRIFHWTLVVFFALAYFTGEEEGELHEIAGYVVLGLISFRVLWGFIGSRYARFRDFIYPPAQVLAYIRSLFAGKPEHYLGHNPLGGVMVLALLVMLFVVTLSGVKLESLEGEPAVTASTGQLARVSEAVAHDEEEGAGRMENPQYEFWEEIHEAATNIMLVLVALHILGVAISGRLHGENLVRAMLTGKKDKHS